MINGCHSRACLALVLWLTLSSWPKFSHASGPGRESDWSPDAVALDLKPVPRVERLTLDTWAGKQTNRSGMDVGLALSFPRGKWRPTLQIAQDRAGFGLGYRLAPVIDVCVGIQGIWDLTSGRLEPGVYVSLFRF